MEDLAALFTEWMDRYHADPASFQQEFGEAVSYGEAAAAYLAKLAAERGLEVRVVVP